MTNAPWGLLDNGLPRRRPFRRRGQNHIHEFPEYVMRIPGHESPYDLAEVAKLAGERFCRQLVDIWPDIFCAEIQATTEKRRSVMLLFLRQIAKVAQADASTPEAALLSGLLEAKVEPLSYAKATASFCARLHDRSDLSIIASTNKRTRNNTINSLGSTFTMLASRGVLPLDHGMTAIMTGPFEPRTLTIAEVSEEGELDRSDARAALSSLLRNTVLAEKMGMGCDQPAILSIQEFSDAMIRILNLRLSALRDCAVADLEAEESVWLQGLQLMARTDLPTPYDFGVALQNWRQKDGIDALLDKLEISRWSKLPGSPRERLTGLVVRAMAPHYTGTFEVRNLDLKLAAAMRECGGLRVITRYFEGTMPAKTAAHLIVLIDTMFNVSVCDRMAAKPFTGRTLRGKTEVATVEAIKRRANYKKVQGVILDSPEDDSEEQSDTCFLEVKRVDKRPSSVWAINTWLKLSEAIRRRAEQDGSDTHLYMWILPEGGKRHRGKIRQPHFTTDNAAWHEFMEKHKSDPIIGGLPITREMIRISCLQARSGGDENSGLLMPRLAQHANPRTSHGYGDTPWGEALLNAQIRTFQDILEAAASSDIEDIAKVLNIPAAAVLARRDLALQNGLGFFCADPLAGERPGTSKGVPCDRLEDCPACRLRRFIPNPEALEALWLFHKTLREERPSWEATRPARWKAIWLPWLAIVMATENVIQSGRYRPKYEKAAADAAERLASGTVSLPVLW
jgi:hypothetical protein